MLSISILLAISTFFAIITAQLSIAGTLAASIKSEEGYKVLPGCINQCVWDQGDDDTRPIGGDLAIHLSCESPWINGCYCRGASASYAYGFLTSCFSYLCTTPAASDIDNGVSIYTSYCSQALGAAYTPNAIPEPAPTDPSSTGSSSDVTPGAGSATSRPTSAMPKETGPANSASPTTETSGQPKGDRKIAGLSKGAFIGVIVSASCSVLGLFFGIAFKVYKHKKHTKLLQQHMVTGVSYQTKA